MKKIFNFGMVITLTIAMVWMACEPGTPSPTIRTTTMTLRACSTMTPPASSDNLDFNELSNDLIIDNATKIPGTIPSVTNAIDIKKDKDTIFN